MNRQEETDEHRGVLMRHYLSRELEIMHGENVGDKALFLQFVGREPGKAPPHTHPRAYDFNQGCEVCAQAN